MRGPEGKRRDALAGDGRGANEEADLPIACNYDGFGLRSGSSQLHNRNDSRCGCNGDDTVHDNAELAVVGVGLAGVQVRDLGNDEHRQQDEAKNGHGRQEATLCAAFAAKNCLKSCQLLRPFGDGTFRLYSTEKTMDLDALGLKGLYLSYGFVRTPEETRTKRKRLN